jgi:hypothetical protein
MDRRDRARREGSLARHGGRRRTGGPDWSAKHLRFDERLEPTVLYDWDSVTTDREPNLVGTAAGSFTYTEEHDEKIAVWPSAEESLAFIDEYESARGAPFRTDERDAAQAACVYLHAYAVRCHHSYGGDARETDLQEIASALL